MPVFDVRARKSAYLIKIKAFHGLVLKILEVQSGKRSSQLPPVIIKGSDGVHIFRDKPPNMSGKYFIAFDASKSIRTLLDTEGLPTSFAKTKDLHSVHNDGFIVLSLSVEEKTGREFNLSRLKEILNDGGIDASVVECSGEKFLSVRFNDSEFGGKLETLRKRADEDLKGTKQQIWKKKEPETPVVDGEAKVVDEPTAKAGQNSRERMINAKKEKPLTLTQ